MATVPGEGRDFGCINCWFFCEIFLPFNSPEKFLITWRATFVPHPSDLSGSTGIAVVNGGQDWPKNFWRVTHRGDFIANDQSALSDLINVCAASFRSERLDRNCGGERWSGLAQKFLARHSSR